MKLKRFLTGIVSVLLAAGILAGCDSGAAPAPQTASSESSGGAASQSAEKGEVQWPDGAVQFLVPSKAGGITDIFARNVQNSLQKSTGGNFATVNYDTEAVGYENLRSAKGDGSSLLFQHSTIICKYLTGAVEYNPQEEFRVVGEVANMGPQAIICSPDAPYSTWEEFISYAKEHPGEINTAIATNGTTHFIFGQVQNTCGVELNLVECSAEADKLTNVAGGIIDVANCSLANAAEYEKAGKLKVLGILGDGKPVEGYDWEPITDVLWISYMYVFAPAGTDDATAQAINQALKSLMDDSEYQAACENLGGYATWFDLETVEADFAKTMEELSDVATSLGINVRA